MQDGLSIIIPTKERGNVLNRTLEAAFNATIQITSEIIIVNDSKTTAPKIDPKYSDRVKVINNPKSGVASARNFGVNNATYSNLLFLDDDIIISQENINKLMQTVKHYPSCAINFNWIYPSELTEKIKTTQFGRYLTTNGFTSLKGWSDNLIWDDLKIFEVDLVASYFLFITKSDFKIVGGYNENFPHAGAEDFDFAMRLKKTGVKGLCDPLSMVLHNEEDRVNLFPWLQRKERSAETRKIAVSLGYKEMAINSPASKIQLYRSIYFFKPVFLFTLKIIPNIKSLDFLYFRIINILLGAYLYKGYFKGK
jgi:glycosyltransferase involved in cell wall biosynthesis